MPHPHYMRMEGMMISVTRLNGEKLMVNCNLIEFVEETPDTVITFTNGIKIVVKESSEEIKQSVIQYKKEIFGREIL